MNLQITITNKDEAQDAVNMLNAYLGNSSVSTVAAKAVEPKETVEEPKKSSKTTTTKKPVAKKEEKPEPEVEEDDGSEEAEDEPETEDKAATESEIDLKALTNIAKEAVERTDRAAAKKVISKYGSKLSEVDESDYAALAQELEAL